MKHSRFLWLIPLAVSVAFVAGCGQKVTIKTNDGTATGTIDTDKQTANINVNGSVLATGEEVQLPANFPSDVYVVPGTIKTAFSTPNVSYSVSLTTPKTLNEVKSLYDTNLVSNGWTITSSGVINVHSAAIIATKSNRTTTVAISDTETPTIVTITVVTDNTPVAP